MASSSQPDSPYVGSLMRICWQWVREQIYAGLLAQGYNDLTRAHIAVFQYPTPEKVRPSQLADRLGVTKQSINDVLNDLERLGYLTREPDPTDGRARVVQLTVAGRRLERAVHREMLAAEQRIAGMIGIQRLTQLCRILNEMAERIGADCPGKAVLNHRRDNQVRAR